MEHHAKNTRGGPVFGRSPVRSGEHGEPCLPSGNRDYGAFLHALVLPVFISKSILIIYNRFALGGK